MRILYPFRRIALLKTVIQFIILNVLSSAAVADVPIVEIKVTHTTASAPKYAKTGDDFTLRVFKPGETGITLVFPDLPHNERELGLLDQYVFDVRGFGIGVEQMRKSKFHLRTHGSNAWLPSHMVVEGKTNAGVWIKFIDRPWPNDRWFSVSSEYREVRTPGWLPGSYVWNEEKMNARAEWDLAE